MKNFIWAMLVWSLLNEPMPAWAFRFISPVDGEAVAAGSTLHLEVDPAGVEQLMAVLFVASVGVLKEKLDAFPPWTWTLRIPPSYAGAMTFSATGRVLGQKNGWAPYTEVRINVILPHQPASIPDSITPPFSTELPDRERSSF